MKRVIFDIVLFLSVFILPWWITVPLSIFGIFLFRNFYEFLVVSAIMYALFAIPNRGVISSPIWFPVIVSVIYIVIQVFRSNIILYKNEI